MILNVINGSMMILHKKNKKIENNIFHFIILLSMICKVQKKFKNV